MAIFPSINVRDVFDVKVEKNGKLSIQTPQQRKNAGLKNTTNKGITIGEEELSSAFQGFSS